MQSSRRLRRAWLLAALVAIALLILVGYGRREGEPAREVGRPAPTVARPEATTEAGTPEPAGVPLVVTSGHPRLFFTEEGLPALRARAASTHKEIFVPILSFARSQLSSRSPSMPKAGDLDGFRNAGNQVIATAFAYVISGDRSYLDLTRRNLLAYSAWQYWGDEGAYGKRLLGFHHMIMGVSIAYDWLYNDLSESDRNTIASALATRAQESYEASSSQDYRDDWGNWWRQSYAQNHHWTIHSALGMAALTLDGTDARASTWLAQATDNLKRDSFLAEGISDGTWHEGIVYQNYLLTMSLPFFHNLERLKGQNILPETYLRNYVYWRTYNYLPDTKRFAMTFGNYESGSENGYEAQNILRFIAGRLGDGRAEWLARQIVNDNPRDANVYSAPWYVFEFLYYDPEVVPKSPDDLPLSRPFPDLGVIISRTGWGTGDLTFGMKSGPKAGYFALDRFIKGEYPFDERDGGQLNTGHDHDDAGTFYLYRGNVELAPERNGYDRKDTKYHNSLLVDGRGQYGEGGQFENPSVFRNIAGSMQATYGTGGYSYIRADLTDFYRNQARNGVPGDRLVDELTRQVLFVPPGYLVMVDAIRDNSNHRYEWISHFGSSVSREGDWIRGQARNGQVLGVNVLSPNRFDTSTDNDGRPFVSIRPSSNSGEVRFVTVLYPTDNSDWPNKPAISSLGDTGEVAGVRVALDGTQDHLIRYGERDSGEVGGYNFDGRVASIHWGSDGVLKSIFFGEGRRLASDRGSRNLIQSPEPVESLEVVYDGTALALSGDVMQGVRIFAPGIDTEKVTANGRPVQVTRSGDYVEIQ